ncbi:complement component C9-like [Ciona intestinalis]
MVQCETSTSSIFPQELDPISSAIPVSMANKRQHMEHALILYLGKYDYSKCKNKCAHGGAVVMVNDGKLCKCLCAANYGGIDCNVLVPNLASSGCL